MATNMNRVVISVPEDIEAEVERLKQTVFYGKPYAEVYRQAIRLGLQQLKAEVSPEKRESSMDCPAIDAKPRAVRYGK